MASFEPTATEVDVSVLNEELERRGVRVIVPITLENLDLDWRVLGTSTPLGLNAIAAADLVVAPALAIGPGGERLGQGGGCYDRTLPRRRTSVPVIAAVFEEESGIAVPVEPHDERVDAVVTPRGVTHFGRRRREDAEPARN